MLGYLRPHAQTSFPGPAKPDYEGETGWYWVELTFQTSPIFFSEIPEGSLRGDFVGDSLIILTDPLPVGNDRNRVFTIQARSAGLDYFVYCNNKGRLSHINVHCNAPGFSQAIEQTLAGVCPFLSGWSLRFNVPISIFRVRALEDKSQVVRSILYHKLYSPVRLSESDLNRVYKVPEDDRIVSFYHDALNATDPKYQYLCYYKVIDLSYLLRARKASEAKAQGRPFAKPKEVLPDSESFTCHLTPDIRGQVVGQKFTSVRENILRPLRNRIAHGFLEGDGGEIVADEEVYPYLPVAKYVAEQLIFHEIGRDLVS